MAKNDFQLLDSAMWHDHDIDFASWLHTAGTCRLGFVKCEMWIHDRFTSSICRRRTACLEQFSSVQFSSLHS